MNKYFKGEELIGNDYSLDQLKEWYEAEKEGYANIVKNETNDYEYNYHNYNIFHGYSKIKGALGNNLKALGIGSAFGDEFKPIKEHLKEIVILDPSEQLKGEMEGVPMSYVSPVISGKMEFKDNSFDVITCFGTLHHIANVEFVLSEMARVLKPSGFMLIREPNISMGDWTKPRWGLTSRERGIPVHLMASFISKAGLKIMHQRLCFSPISTRIWRILGSKVINTPWFVRLDYVLSKVFSIKMVYYRTKKWHHLGAINTFWVLTK